MPKKLVKTPTKVLWDTPGKTQKIRDGRTRSGKLPSGVAYSVDKSTRPGERYTQSVAVGKEGSYIREKRPKGNVTGVTRKDEFMPRDRSKASWQRKTVLNSGEVRHEKDKPRKKK